MPEDTGERKAGGEVLVGQCEGLIRSFIGKYGLGRHPIDPEDILQESRIRLWKALENGNDIRHLAAYVKKIVDSVVFEDLRQIRRDQSLLQAGGLGPFAGEPDGRNANATRPRMEETLAVAVGSLKRNRRVVLTMTIAGFSLPEIAAINRWTRKKTYALYERGVKDLRKIIQAEGCRS
jgi:DNA-directed RNA polymerase specialized sigma24 family protein